jgi:hypothetical protein
MRTWFTRRHYRNSLAPQRCLCRLAGFQHSRRRQLTHLAKGMQLFLGCNGNSNALVRVPDHQRISRKPSCVNRFERRKETLDSINFTGKPARHFPVTKCLRRQKSAAQD